MRKLILFTGFLALAALLSAQNLASNPGFEEWTDGSPDGWVGSKTTVAGSNIIQYDTSVHEGS
ncbi:MAG: hypothetical protein JW996_01850, partial [Candidatus Cloacimonetes bacterium]|nr:hypothetical protein [Candidatus Cloacimonadota bacterium]